MLESEYPAFLGQYHACLYASNIAIASTGMVLAVYGRQYVFLLHT